ncbi:MAG: STAS domain-containing protein [Phycisphaerae bacterium]|nr:STAS domain-containing protein [Phycisphaerae bacterium]
MFDGESGDLQVTSRSEGDAIVVVPVGDIDLAGSPTLREELKRVSAGRPAKMIVDLSAVSYMDSSGVATLVEALQTARKSRAKLVLCNLQDRVRSIFEIAKLETVFTIMPTLDAAKSA